MTKIRVPVGDVYDEVEKAYAEPNEEKFHPKLKELLENERLEKVKLEKEVSQPDHYTIGGIETIDYMVAKSTPDEFMGHCRLTAIKYLSRAGYKDDALKDFKKAAVYLGWLIKYLETGKIK